MIKVIYGKKGSGKTKRIIDLANESIKEQKGDVLFLDDDNRYMFDLRHEIRFINAGEYGVHSGDTFYGFVGGLLAQNFDVSLIFVDAFLKLTGCAKGGEAAIKGLGWLFDKLKQIGSQHSVDFVLSVSGDPDTCPDFIKEYCV
ncbi:hypothetical protein AGMMS49992_14050 [Clostridia bacterium]|nr:hypothetical protein AGMMS49992_14050 [Clostridia bacterium]